MMTMRSLFSLSRVFSIITPLLIPQSALAEIWDFRDQEIRLGYAYEKRTVSERFVGNKVILDAQSFISSEQDKVSERLICCARPSLPEHFYGLMNVQTRWGMEDTALEYIHFNLTPMATMWHQARAPEDHYTTKWDLLEMGATRLVVDDALGVDSYLEVSLFTRWTSWFLYLVK